MVQKQDVAAALRNAGISEETLEMIVCQPDIAHACATAIQDTLHDMETSRTLYSRPLYGVYAPCERLYINGKRRTWDEVMAWDVKYLALPARTANSLIRQGVNPIERLLEYSPSELTRLRLINQDSVGAINKALQSLGLRLSTHSSMTKGFVSYDARRVRIDRARWVALQRVEPLKTTAANVLQRLERNGMTRLCHLENKRSVVPHYLRGVAPEEIRTFLKWYDRTFVPVVTT